MLLIVPVEGLDLVPGIKFPVNILEVFFHGVLTDKKPVSDLLVAATLRHEPYDVLFPAG